MKKEFWIEKWENSQTGFHKKSLHPLLEKHLFHLSIMPGDTIFVPLCGKSVDMLWLDSMGFNVIGVELSPLAVEQFFSENGLSYEIERVGSFSVYKYNNIRIYQGDFFQLSAFDLGSVKAVYDRAAFIALPEGMTNTYIRKMREIVPSSAKYLLITLEFEKKSGPSGPPFSTTNDKVLEVYKDFVDINLIEEIDIIQQEPKFRQQGCDFLIERVYLIA